MSRDNQKQHRAGGSRGSRGGRGARGSSPGRDTTPTTSPAGPDRGRGRRGRGRRGFDNRGGGRGGGGLCGGGPAQVFAGDRPARPDDRLSTSDALVNAFKRFDVGAEMPLRPGWGTLGRPITVRSNFFAVKLPKGMSIFDYEVSFSPKVTRMQQQVRLFKLLEESPQCAPYVGHIAHDASARLVSARKLPQPLSLAIRYYEEGEAGPHEKALTITINITLTRELKSDELTPYLNGQPDHRDDDILPLVSALNMILQQHATKVGVRAGLNRYFFPTLARFPLGLGLETWKGFFMSVRPAYKQLMVNINVCMTAFYIPGNLADAMLAFQNQSQGGMPRSFYQKFKVSTRHLGYVKKRGITAIMQTSARRTQFQCEELGGTVTVEQYFQRKHNITLVHADDLPVINVSTNRAKPNYLPAEICEIFPGQPYRGWLGERETAEMIKYACNPPAVNATSIVGEGFDMLGLRPGALGQTLAGFGISVNGEMACTPARILLAPSISYKVGRADLRDAGWNILNVKFQAGGDMTNWAVLLVQDGGRSEFRGASDPELLAFLKTFAKKCSDSGMTVPNGPPSIMETGPLPRRGPNDPWRVNALRRIHDTITRGLNPRQKFSFVLVLLSDHDTHIYSGIKRLGDVVLGLHTVHMVLQSMRQPRMQDQYFSNVALKINTKLGGINHMLDSNSTGWLTAERTMLVGIDVVHPGPTSMLGTPSIVAVVASVDDAFVHFPASITIQASDTNEITMLTAMMIERLLVFQKKNWSLPEKILVFRTGVSETQYHLLLREELPSIKAAFEKVYTTSPLPKLTITICTKQHHACNWAAESTNMVRSGNTLPGTVIDKGVTGIYDFDYYLQAHNVPQGQARLMHYTVIYDENHHSADAMQQGTHAMSYLNARATRAIKLIPPVHYAALACRRGICYLNNLHNFAFQRGDMDDFEAEKTRVFKEAEKMWGNGIHSDLKDSMFYI